MNLLFESLTEIVSTEGKLLFFQGYPELHPQPLDMPDPAGSTSATQKCATVLRKSDHYQMWWHAKPKDWRGHKGGMLCLAESDDGMTWRRAAKPVVCGFGLDAVIEVPDAPSAQRYQGIGLGIPGLEGASPQLTRTGYYTGHSADGCQWEPDGPEPKWIGGDVGTMAYHPIQRRALACFKKEPRYGGVVRRSIWTAERVDGVWAPEACALVPDDFDDVCAAMHGFSSADYYKMGILPVANGTVGFLCQFRHCLPRTQPPFIPAEKGIYGATDISLVFQRRPGDRWLHVPGRQDFISHRQAPWMRGGVYASSCATEAGHEQRMYFTSQALPHGWRLNTQWQPIPQRQGQVDEMGEGRIGFAHWPRDRLFGFRAEGDGVLTLDLGVPRDPCELRLNYRTTLSSGSVRVEIVDREGYAEVDATPMTGDALEATVCWRHGSRIDPPGSGRLLARIHMDSAEVFAYEVRTSTTSAGNKPL